MSELYWERGDLALVRGHGAARWTVIDAGNTSNSGFRVEIRVSTGPGGKGIDCLVEGSLTRPSIRSGDWVRSKKSWEGSFYRVARVRGPQLIFDATYRRIDGIVRRRLEHGPVADFVPIEKATYIESALAQDHENLAAEVSRLKEQWEHEHELRLKAENDHKSVLGQRDKEREDKWQAQTLFRDAGRKVEMLKSALAEALEAKRLAGKTAKITQMDNDLLREQITRLAGQKTPPKIVM